MKLSSPCANQKWRLCNPRQSSVAAKSFHIHRERPPEHSEPHLAFQKCAARKKMLDCEGDQPKIPASQIQNCD